MRQLIGSMIKQNVLIWFNNDMTYCRQLRPLLATSCVQKVYKSSLTPSTKTVDQLVVNKNMSLRYCHPRSVSTNNTMDNKSATIERPAVRPLVVFFAWMLAKDKHIEKYRNLYFRRGFDVLTVKTSPFELMFPTIGSQRIAASVADFLNQKVTEYPEVVVHAFSVGAYQFGEVLVQMEKQENEKILPKMKKAIKGLICDSAADLEAIPNGLSRAITNNSVLRVIFRTMIATHMKLFYSVATKHYMASSEAYKNNVIRCPSLLFVSNGDVVGTPESNRRVMDRWHQKNIDVKWICFDKSSHVGHLYKYQEEYTNQLDSFLKNIDL
ncbi:uncharacterized protein LOC128952139 [Oppia nitens]|uniref:uncharacterized protein LOC128952139 n=1 Tax=Oppia nitens TaxID=1686743 RepID=UPI0023D978D4|nr:uncharacterized protein LOC128952139 [Oppia nitens]